MLVHGVWALLLGFATLGACAAPPGDGGPPRLADLNLSADPLTPARARVLALAAAPDCDAKAYQKAALVHISGARLASLFDDGAGDDPGANPRPGAWEASGVALPPPVGPGAPPPPAAVIVMDNTAQLPVLLPETPGGGPASNGPGGGGLAASAGVLLPPPVPLPAPADPARPGVSEWEGVAFGPDAGTLLALVEAAVVPGQPAGGPRRARVDELRLPGSLSPPPGGTPGSAASAPPPAPVLVRSCFVDFDLRDDNKGLEDLVFLGGGRALFLCEGNGCVGGREGRDPGRGVLLLARLDFSPDAAGEPGGCVWRVDKVVPLPPSAAFEDYSGLTLRDGVLAVLSQVDGAVWVGRWDEGREEAVDLAPAAAANTPPATPTAIGKKKAPSHHPGTKKKGPVPAVRPGWPGPVFPLPRDGSCRRALCTAEGVAWLDPPTTPGARLVLTTDRAKPGLFPWSCVAGSQGLHVVGLPEKGEVVGGGGRAE